MLDLGCGWGAPIGRWLIETGYRVTGLGVAAAMLVICRRRCPEGEWIRVDMRSLDPGRRFGGIVARDSFFHLLSSDPQAMFPILARHPEPGGAHLFTSGPEAGEGAGAVAGMPICHAQAFRGLRGYDGGGPRRARLHRRGFRPRIPIALVLRSGLAERR